MRDYDYYFGNCKNLKEWEEAADLVSLRGYDEINNGVIQVRNPGVRDSECVFKFQGDSGNFYGAVFTLEENYLEFAGCKSKTHPRNTTITDSYITFNSKNHLIEGWYDNNGILEKSGNIYNEYIIAGDFFSIPTMEGREIGPKIFISPRHGQEQSLADQFMSIDYDYYYY